jgi:predicted nucleic acid-binding protein
LLLLDTCVLINLIASGSYQEILPYLSQTFTECGITSAVQNESTVLKDAIGNLLSINDLIVNFSLVVTEPETDLENDYFVSYSASLGDGEAMSLALAITRNYHIATDDLKAKRIYLQEVSNPANPQPNRLLTTSELIHHWSVNQQIAVAQIRTILLHIQQQARFIPSPKVPADPYYQWWQELSQSSL